MNTLQIGSRIIGDGHPAYMIAEMSGNHAGSIERAKEIIHAAAEAGADCIKIQTYTPDTLTIDCSNKYFAITEGTWKGENLYSLYGKAYTPLEWQEELFAEARKTGIDFFSTPFDNATCDFLENMGVDFYKIASFEMIDLKFLKHVASKGKPMIVSTGMGTYEEMKEALNAIYETGNTQVAFLKCSSAYPALSSQMNLRTIPDMKDKFGIPIGLSDHSMGSLGAVAAVSLGANIIEKHFCLSREIENPDASFSMTPEEYRKMVDDVRDVEAALGEVSYSMTPQEESNMVFRRSLFAVKDIEAGESFTEENIRSIRPGYGAKPKYIDDFLTMKAAAPVKRGEPLNFELVEKGKVLFLTNNSNTDDFYEKLIKKCPGAVRFTNRLTAEIVNALKPSFVISFNYKYIVSEDVLNLLEGKIINLHTSFLPYNKGASPNFFALYDGTPSGVTIHTMSAGLDKGDILLQKEIKFDKSKETFASTYNKLIEEMTNLFFENADALLTGQVKGTPQIPGEGTYHSSKDLKAIRGEHDFTWDENVEEVLKRIK